MGKMAYIKSREEFNMKINLSLILLMACSFACDENISNLEAADSGNSDARRTSSDAQASVDQGNPGNDANLSTDAAELTDAGPMPDGATS